MYAGTNLTGDKKDSNVNGKTINNSGIANFVLFENTRISSAQEAIDNLITVDEYASKYPEVYFACKALNYRSFDKKYDGNRPLSVYVDWSVRYGKLAYELVFDTPLKVGGNEAYSRLISALDTLGITTTNDINEDNIESTGIVW